MKLLTKLDELLQGKKSYIVSAATIIGAIALYYAGKLPADEALQLALGGLGLFTLRDAVRRK